eukprot:NODE_199_length_13192_cov_0.539219.p5 type:complete len:338 gc:universal NODE_199_length_13192_cov_0.539219:2753-3766(+)
MSRESRKITRAQYFSILGTIILFVVLVLYSFNRSADAPSKFKTTQLKDNLMEDEMPNVRLDDEIAPQKIHLPDPIEDDEFLIPQTVFMSVKNLNPTDEHALKAIAAMKKFPDYKLELFDDDKCIEIASKYKHVLDLESTVKNLPHGVMKSDFCRYIMIYDQGGIYVDSDVMIMKDPREWMQTANTVENPQPIRMIVGLEIAYTSEPTNWKLLDYYVGMQQFVQWSFAAAPKHEILWDCIYEIHSNFIKDPASFQGGKGQKFNINLIQKTGPGVFTRAVQKYMNRFKIGSDALYKTPVIINDLYIGGTDLFNCLPQYNDCVPTRGIWHLFSGRWKKPE